MKLFLLQRCAGRGEARAFVVRAKDRDQAKWLAAEECGDEGEAVWMSNGLGPPSYVTSTCEELTADGELGVILRDLYES